MIGAIIRLASLFGFSLSPLIGGAVIAGAITLAIGAAWIAIDNHYDAKCEAAALRQQLANKQTDLDAAKQAAKDSADAMAESDARAQENQQKANDYEAELKKRPNGACTLTDDDLRQLYGDAKPRTR